ncbi:tyrosine-type recombinase/integrase [Thalassotalea sp. PLHSN55]|uniref:tyrosine-type recombinase/integrase n=1 Tax=Thalassotalea sp. PLHSN55 TaxID=3435888 RepID=UPI003F830D46
MMTTCVVNITNTMIENQKENVTVTQLRDARTSLHFRYSKVNRNKGVFYVRVYKNNQDKMIKIGKYPEISVQQAQRAIPHIHLKDEHFKQNEITTVEQLCQWYIERVKNNKQISDKTIKQTVSMVNKHIAPYFKDVKVEDINDGLIDKQWFTPIQSSLSLSTIALVIVTMNAMFAWAIRLQLINKSAVSKISLANFTNQRPTVKVGRLTQLKLKQSLKGLYKQPIAHQVLFVLLLLHGTRIGETTKARWIDFDFKKNLWRIPSKDTKTKKPHTLPLSPLAVKWLKAYKKYQYKNKRSQWLFPQLGNNRKAQSSNVSSRIISNIAKGEWSAHDIRKYARSCWLENGVDYVIGELLLNHSLSKLDQSYIQTTAMNLCSEALIQWSASLQELGLTPPNFTYKP